MRLLTWVLAPVLLLGLAGCGDDPGANRTSSAPSSAAATELPENLCDVVEPAVSSEWELSELNHAAQDEVLMCTLGTEETQLVTSFSAVEPDELEAAFAAACDQYATEPADADRCTSTGPEMNGEPAGQHRLVARLDEPSGILVVTFNTMDPEKAETAPELLADVEEAVAFD